MKIFIICTVRNADDLYRQKLNNYVLTLERQGHEVYLPHMDTNQKETGINICLANRQAIKNADEVHVFYNLDSQGTHFDLGMAFMENKKLKVVENIEYGEGKSYPRMIHEWEMQI